MCRVGSRASERYLTELRQFRHDALDDLIGLPNIKVEGDPYRSIFPRCGVGDCRKLAIARNALSRNSAWRSSGTKIVSLSVQSRSEMGRVDFETLGAFRPNFANVFMRRKAGEGFEAFGEIVGDKKSRRDACEAGHGSSAAPLPWVTHKISWLVWTIGKDVHARIRLKRRDARLSRPPATARR